MLNPVRLNRLKMHLATAIDALAMAEQMIEDKEELETMRDELHRAKQIASAVLHEID